MINRIIYFSIHNKLIIGLLTLALVGAGIWSMTEVPLDAVPDITNNQVQVITQAPNLATEDIEQFVTYPIEVAMANLPGVVEIRSISRFGLSVVTIVFEDDMGTYLPRQLVSEQLVQVKNDIPEGMGEIGMGPIATGLGEIYQYTLQVEPAYQGQYSATELRTIQDWIVRRQMAMLPGVVEVNAFGGNIKQYEVAVDPNELRAIDLTISDIFVALERNNRNTGGAYIEKDHMANFIRGEGLARSIEDIENIVIKTVEGIPIRVKDVANVRFGEAVRYGAFTKDGQGEAVGGIVFMLKGASSNEVIGNVKERIEQIQESLPEGVTIVPFLDRSELISQTTRTVSTNLIEGALIVILVLVFLLGNWRGGLIVASTIPLSLLFAFILMNIFDVWANLMSLGAIDFGIIVDGAVIIVEGTVFYLYRHIKKGNEPDAKTRDKLTYKASGKMMNSAFFGQLIILIVFLPILFLEGVEGKMFQPMAYTFMFAMLGAMILCLTYVPMMSALFIRVRKKEKLSYGDKFVHWLERKYELSLGAALKRSFIILIAAAGLFAAAVFAFTRMGGEFIPQLDEGDIAFHILLKPGSSLSEGIQTSTKIEQILIENFPEVEHAMTRFGVAEVPTDPMPMDIGDCFVILKPKSEWISADSKEELVEKMKEKLSILPGVNYEFTQPIEMRFNELISGVREDIAIKLFGEDLDILAEKAEEMGRIISTVEGVGDMKVEATSGLPQMTIHYERGELAQYGLNIEDVNKTIEAAFAGGKAGVIFEGERRFDLVVRLDSTHRRNIDDVRNLFINTPNGTQIPLKEIANISYISGPMQISRENTNRRTYVGINVRGRDIQSLVQEIRQRLNEELDLPPGYYIRYGGAFENLERATSRLKIVVPIALILIFILIFFALGSFKQTLMIYMAIPLAAIGGIFSLWIRGMPFSISAGVGFIVLFGVAVLNGLVLISGWNELKEEGVTDINERIKEGAKRRIRPILLTALTDILGFLPMAISTSAGAEVQQPLATVVIGGMITSTLLTLFILPILYRFTESKNFRPPRVGTETAVVAAFIFISLAVHTNAQPTQERPVITLDEAIDKILQNHPQMRSAELQTQQQQALRATAWDLGTTEIFYGGEEIGSNEGAGDPSIYTIGISQRNINIFGIGPNLKLIDQRVRLEQQTAQLTQLEIIQKVKQAYAEAFVSKLKLQLYVHLDSIYSELQNANELMYEVEEISKLTFLATSNKVKQVKLMRQQAQFDYTADVVVLNTWMLSDTLYGVVTSFQDELLQPVQISDSIDQHPLLEVYRQKVNVADQERRVARSNLYPQLNAQYGRQSIGGDFNHYQYQIGVSIPLLFFSDRANIRAATIRKQITEQDYRQRILNFRTEYLSLIEAYRKWYTTWQYYRDEGLPYAAVQREGAILAYKEGAIDYPALVQLLDDALQVELNAHDALLNYMNTKFALEYYLRTSN